MPELGGLSRILAIAILAFVVIASGVLLWDGLALSASREQAVQGRAAGAARFRVAVGAIGFALALWLVLGLVTHAH